MKIHVLPYDDSLPGYMADKLAASKDKSGTDKDFSNYAVVFPGKRPALYLRHILAEKLGSPFYPPAVFSVDEFVRFIADKNGGAKNEIDDSNASWLLYCALKDICKDPAELKFIKEAERFEDFFSWGILIYNAINELDAGLIKNESIKSVKSFNFDYIPESISKFYSYFPDLRDKFHAKIREKNLTTPGLNYLDASDFFKNNGKPLIIEKLGEFEKIYFAGISFPSKGEAYIIRTLADAGIAELYTQADSSSAGEQFKNFSNNETEIIYIKADGTDLKNSGAPTQEPAFYFYESGDTHSGLLACGKALAGGVFNPEKTAVILPDAGTLVPFLYHVMDDAGIDYNITMGYPVKRTPFYSLITSIFSAQESVKPLITAYAYDGGARGKEKNKGAPVCGYSAKAYLNLIKHPYIKTLRGIETISAINAIEKRIVKNGDSLISPKNVESYYLKDIDKDSADVIKLIHKYFFENFERPKITVNDFAVNFLEIIRFIIKLNKGIFTYEFSPEFIKKIIEAVNLFQEAYFKDELFEKKSVFRLFKYFLDNESVAFNGIPLKGMQIMGILETRVLKFDRVVIFDADEDILPPVKKFDPILPHAVRKKIGLLTYSDREAIYRYHFRRLILGSKEAHIVYIKNNKRIRSRFIEEIIWENEKKSKTFDIEKKIISLGFKAEMPEAGYNLSKRGARKTGETLKIIGESINRLSASAINAYLNCPMQFYYKYAAMLKEAEVLKKGMGADKTGIFVHNVLKIFYEGIKKKSLDINRLLEDDAYLHSETVRAIEDMNNMSEIELDADNGEYFLVKESAKKILHNFIKNDLKSSNSDNSGGDWQILGIEESKEAVFKTDAGEEGTQKEITLYGKIDRIDGYAREGRVVNATIIDYKTGASSLMPDISRILENAGKGLSPLKDRIQMKKIIKSFQLPVYIYLLKNEKNESGRDKYDYDNIDACLSLTGKSDGNAAGGCGNRLYLINGKIKKDNVAGMKILMEELFIPSLKYLIEEMLNKEEPFAPDYSDPKICEYCPYILLCGKI